MSADIEHVSWRRKGDSQSSVHKEGFIYTSYTFSVLTVSPHFPVPWQRRAIHGWFTAVATGPPPPSHWAPNCCFWSKFCLSYPQQGMNLACLPLSRCYFMQFLGASVTSEATSALSNTVENQQAGLNLS